jgi:hypothetical protein
MLGLTSTRAVDKTQYASTDTTASGKFITLIIALAMLTLGGCDDLASNSRATKPQAPSPTASVQPISPPTISPSQLELFDGSLQRLAERALTGDLRPFWLVSGRIRNNSSKMLSEVRIRIYINLRGKPGDVEDEAVIDIPTDISPASVGSFSRKIQLLPPQEAWEWDWTVDDARVKE